MKNLWAKSLGLSALVLTLIVIMNGPQFGETKKIKIKKVLKELKKLKKYGYLLASQRKKLYAIPFPMPLPIFVKRQHIYTSVPIIPRYIPYPSHHHSSSSSSHGGGSSYSMASSSSETSAAASPPPPQPMYESMLGNSYEYAHQESPMYKQTSMSAAYGAALPYRSSRSKKHLSSAQDASSSSYANAIPTTGKYLAQLANVLGQSYPGLGGTSSSSATSKDILTKILNGQAKVLPPTSLLSAIKGPSSALLNLYQQQSSSSSSSHNSPSSSSDKDQDSKSEGGSSSSSSASSSANDDSSSSDSTSSSSSKSPQSSSQASSSQDVNKPSASEMHRSRYKPYMIRTPYGRIPAAAAHMMPALHPAMGHPAMMPSPFAFMAAAQQQSPALMRQIPMLQANQMAAGAASAGADYPVAMPAIFPGSIFPVSQVAASPSDHMEPQSSELNEMFASNNNNNSNQQDDQLSQYQQAALILQRRRQALLRLALLKQREEAAQLVRSRAATHELPTATMSQVQATQLLDRYKLQQQLHQLRQLQQLQQYRQHQMQLQQNTIDNL